MVYPWVLYLYRVALKRNVQWLVQIIHTIIFVSFKILQRLQSNLKSDSIELISTYGVALYFFKLPTSYHSKSF